MNLEGISINKQSSIRIEKSHTIYIDPWDRTEEKDADIIFITHDHFDHFSVDTINRLRKPNTILVAPKSMKDKVEKELSFKKESILYTEPLREYGVMDITFSTLPMYNRPGVKFHTKEMGWNGYLIDIDHTTYYIMGDTDTEKELNDVKCDVLFIPIGGHFTMGWKEAAEYTLKVKPSTVIPTHYMSVVGSKEDGIRFKELVEKENKDISVALMLG